MDKRRSNLNKSAKAKKSKKKSWLKISIVTCLAILIIAGASVAYLFTQAQKTLKKTYVSTHNTNKSIQASKPLTILLMGVDTGGEDRGGADSWNGNPDSQIILTLNPKTKTATMISMERDTMTNILDEKGQIVSRQKMNAAFPMGFNNLNGLQGAVEYAMNTIGNEAGIKIDNFVAMNMDGFKHLVDDVGGIDVVNDSGDTITIANTEPEYKATVPYIKGNPKQHINGEQALVFARDRDTLPNGDYGRAAHQREVLTELFGKLLSLNNVTKYQKFLDDISKDFKTNISVKADNILALMAYKDCLNKIVSVHYQGLGNMAAGSNGIQASYQFIPQESSLAVQNLLRRAVNQAPIVKLDPKLITYESFYGTEPNVYFLPSATVTERGKLPVVFGVNPDGNFVKLDKTNATKYVSTQGSSVKVS